MKDIKLIEQLKVMLGNDAVRGCASSSNGEIVVFKNRGVVDLFNLLDSSPGFLENGCVVDRVIGRGAALLLIKGGVSQVYARLISEPALNVLSHAGVVVQYDKLVPNIINRTGTGICPVEKLTMGISDPEEAFEIIRNFLTKTISK